LRREWGRRLNELMAAVAADLQIEFQGLTEAGAKVRLLSARSNALGRAGLGLQLGLRHRAVTAEPLGLVEPAVAALDHGIG